MVLEVGRRKSDNFFRSTGRARISRDVLSAKFFELGTLLGAHPMRTAPSTVYRVIKTTGLFDELVLQAIPGVIRKVDLHAADTRRHTQRNTSVLV